MNRTQRRELSREVGRVGNLSLTRLEAVEIRPGDVLVVSPEVWIEDPLERGRLIKQISAAFRGVATVMMPKEWRIEVVRRDELPAGAEVSPPDVPSPSSQTLEAPADREGA